MTKKQLLEAIESLEIDDDDTILVDYKYRWVKIESVFALNTVPIEGEVGNRAGIIYAEDWYK